MPLIRLGPLANVLVDVAAWLLIHSATGYAVHRLPQSRSDLCSCFGSVQYFGGKPVLLAGMLFRALGQHLSGDGSKIFRCDPSNRLISCEPIKLSVDNR